MQCAFRKLKISFESGQWPTLLSRLLMQGSRCRGAPRHQSFWSLFKNQALGGLRWRGIKVTVGFEMFCDRSVSLLSASSIAPSTLICSGEPLRLPRAFLRSYKQFGELLPHDQKGWLIDVCALFQQETSLFSILSVDRDLDRRDCSVHDRHMIRTNHSTVYALMQPGG